MIYLDNGIAPVLAVYSIFLGRPVISALFKHPSHLFDTSFTFPAEEILNFFNFLADCKLTSRNLLRARRTDGILDGILWEYSITGNDHYIDRAHCPMIQDCMNEKVDTLHWIKERYLDTGQWVSCI